MALQQEKRIFSPKRNNYGTRKNDFKAVLIPINLKWPILIFVTLLVINITLKVFT